MFQMITGVHPFFVPGEDDATSCKKHILFRSPEMPIWRPSGQRIPAGKIVLTSRLSLSVRTIPKDK